MSGVLVETAHRAHAHGNQPMMIGRQDHAEAEVEIETEKEDVVGVVIVIVPEGEVENVEATSEDAVIAGTETEIRGGAGAPTDEAETRTKNDGAEVAIGKGRGGEVLIEILLGEETAEKTEKVEKKNDHEVDEWKLKTGTFICPAKTVISLGCVHVGVLHPLLSDYRIVGILWTHVNISLFYIIIRFIFNFIGTSSPLLGNYLCVSRFFFQTIFNQTCFYAYIITLVKNPVERVQSAPSYYGYLSWSPTVLDYVRGGQLSSDG